ncbi:MAG: penicillin acylase family protein, partial [Terriglobia bacterium]
LSEYAQSGHKISMEDMERLQGDISPLPAQYLKRLLATAAGNSQDPGVRLLLGWDGAVGCDSAAAALYEVWLAELERAVTHRLLPQKSWAAMEWRVPLPVILNYLEHPDAEAFGPNPEAGRDRLLLDTLKAAAERTRSLEGPDSAQWTWGRIHTVTFHHPLELLSGARELFDRGPFPRPGDSYTVSAASYRGNNFHQVSGPSYREIIDTGNWDNSLTVNVPGESGQPGSPHYADLIGLWDQVRYFPILFSRAAVVRNTQNRLALEPASKP